MTFAGKAAIVGIGETAFVRHAHQPVKSLVLEAIDAALEDAGLSASQVDAIVTEGAAMPALVPQDEVAACLGIRNYSTAAASFYGSGIAGAHLLAAQAIASGNARVVVSYFGVDWGSRSGAAYGAAGRGGIDVGDDPKEVFERPYGYYGQPLYFAAIANRYMHVHGIELEPALAAIAIQQRRHARLNGRAQMTKPLDLSAYKESPVVADPLRVTDCCLLTDGAAATVMVATETAAALRPNAVVIAGASLRGIPIDLDRYFTQNPDFLGWPAAHSAISEALSMAGSTLEELDFAELYDCFTMTVLMQLESIGWCGPGEGPAYIGDGSSISISGRIPINTHGGLLSHSYLLGMSHITEAFRQLSGTAGASQIEGATTGLVGLLAGPHYGALVLRSLR